MKHLPHLFESNRAWTEHMREVRPDFFPDLADQQAPEYLWIGCSDSRVPANEIVGLLPGHLFVHRNVANLVIHADLNCLAVLQYAVEILKVQHIIVCGHYRCGGVLAAMDNDLHGLVDNWLGPVRDLHRRHRDALDGLASAGERADRLCELNVVEQVANVGYTTVVLQAWDRGQPVIVHGWIYDVADGLLRDLDVSVTSRDELRQLEQRAIHSSPSLIRPEGRG